MGLLYDRKNNRMPKFDYSQNGYYFITICVKDRRRILCDIVGGGVLDTPKIKLSKYGLIAEKHINQLNNFYNNIFIEKYVIMPDHIHLMLFLNKGQSGTPVPTDAVFKIDKRNSDIAKFVSTFKRFCNKEFGSNLFQRSYYDHVIRNQQDYSEIWQYIDNNPINWKIKYKR